jgi:energy-converting hydrogenase Eha subunit H
MEKWHLSKSVNLSHIVTTVIILLTGLTYITNIDKAVATQDIQIKANTKAIELNQQSNKDMFNRIDSKLDKIFDILYKEKK